MNEPIGIAMVIQHFNEKYLSGSRDIISCPDQGRCLPNTTNKAGVSLSAQNNLSGGKHREADLANHRCNEGQVVSPAQLPSKEARIDNLTREIDHLRAAAEDSEQGNFYEQEIALGLWEEVKELELELDELLGGD